MMLLAVILAFGVLRFETLSIDEKRNNRIAQKAGR